MENRKKITDEGPIPKNIEQEVKTGKWSPKVKDTYVCNYCGHDEVYEKVFINMNTGKQDYEIKETTTDEYASNCCNDFERPVTEFEWHEILFEECNGNKDEIFKIMDGSRS